MLIIRKCEASLNPGITPGFQVTGIFDINRGFLTDGR